MKKKHDLFSYTLKCCLLCTGRTTLTVCNFCPPPCEMFDRSLESFLYSFDFMAPTEKCDLLIDLSDHLKYGFKIISIITFYQEINSYQKYGLSVQLKLVLSCYADCLLDRMSSLSLGNLMTTALKLCLSNLGY